MTSHWKLGLSFSLVTVLMWGLLPIALKATLDGMDPVTITWYRFSISALIALAWYGHARGRELRQLLTRQYRLLTLTAITAILCNYQLYIWGLDHITPGAAQILIQLAPLLMLIGSIVIFKEHFSRLQWLGVTGLIAGMLFFFHQRLTDIVLTTDSYLVGVGLIVAAATSWSVYALAQKKLQTAHDAKDILFLICLFGTVLFWPVAEPRQILALTISQFLLLVFCGLNTIIAYGAFGLAMSYWESSRVSAILPLAPLLTLLFTFALNRYGLASIPAEPLDWLSLLGAILVVAGSAVAALPRERARP